MRNYWGLKLLIDIAQLGALVQFRLVGPVVRHAAFSNFGFRFLTWIKFGVLGETIECLAILRSFQSAR